LRVTRLADLTVLKRTLNMGSLEIIGFPAA